MTELAPWPVRPLSARVPPGERRNPMAMARVAVGPLVLEVAVLRARKTGLTVRLPLGECGQPAIETDDVTWQAIQAAAIGAVKTAPETQALLFGPEGARAARTKARAQRRASMAALPVSAEVLPFLREGA